MCDHREEVIQLKVDRRSFTQYSGRIVSSHTLTQLCSDPSPQKSTPIHKIIKTIRTVNSFCERIDKGRRQNKLVSTANTEISIQLAIAEVAQNNAV